MHPKNIIKKNDEMNMDMHMCIIDYVPKNAPTLLGIERRLHGAWAGRSDPTASRKGYYLSLLC